MKCEGKQLTPGDIVYHQPDHITLGTPHKLVFVRTANGSPGDAFGLFRHSHSPESDMPHVHGEGDVYRTRQAATRDRAAKLRALADQIERQP